MATFINSMAAKHPKMMENYYLLLVMLYLIIRLQYDHNTQMYKNLKKIKIKRRSFRHLPLADMAGVRKCLFLARPPGDKGAHRREP